jgi:hypothetical protein
MRRSVGVLVQLHWTEFWSVSRRPTSANSGFSSILEALLKFKTENHLWGWKAETKASENRTVLGGIGGCRRRLEEEEEEEEEGKGFANKVSRATICSLNQ